MNSLDEEYMWAANNLDTLIESLKWRPISEYPFDGSKILALDIYGCPQVIYSFWHGGKPNPKDLCWDLDPDMYKVRYDCFEWYVPMDFLNFDFLPKPPKGINLK